MDVTLRQARIFLAVVEHGSFSLAARSMFLSQSAVSRAIQDLESVVRTELIVRTSRHMSLTPAGEEFARLAGVAVNSFDHMTSGFERYLLGIAGGVHIAMLPSIAAVIIPPIAAEFRRQFPDVSLNIVDFLAADLDEYANFDDVDFAITFLPNDSGIGRPNSRHVSSVKETPLLKDDLVAILPIHHPLTRFDVVTWRQVAEHPLITTSPNSSTGVLVEHTLSAQGIDYQVHTQTRNIAAVGGIVSAGIGVSIVPALALPLMNFGNFEVRRLIEPKITRSLGIVGPPVDSLAPPARRFFEVLLRATEYGASGTIPDHVYWTKPLAPPSLLYGERASREEPIP